MISSRPVCALTFHSSCVWLSLSCLSISPSWKLVSLRSVGCATADCAHIVVIQAVQFARRQGDERGRVAAYEWLMEGRWSLNKGMGSYISMWWWIHMRSSTTSCVWGISVHGNWLATNKPFRSRSTVRRILRRPSIPNIPVRPWRTVSRWVFGSRRDGPLTPNAHTVRPRRTAWRGLSVCR